MKRTYISEITPNTKNVFLEGWVADIRDLGGLKFILLRDKSGIIQVTVIKKKTDSKLFGKISEISKETVVSVEGEVTANKKAPGGLEIIPSSIEVINKATSPLPIDISQKSQTNIDKRLDYRFLDIRNPKIHAIFNIQSEITYSFREFFHKEGFIEIQCPSIISSASEGGTELFPVLYFEKPAFLAQSPQLYKQMCAISLEKVTTITPVWRAEKHNTIRHLNESRQMDIEMAFADEFIVMDYLAKAIQYIVENINKKCKRDLEVLKIKLETPKVKYLTYEETLKLLGKNKLKIKYGEDLTPEAEKKLCELFKNHIVFVHDWPLKIKPFYIMPKTLEKDEKISRGFDALYNGVEISSGGQRVHLPDILEKQLKEKGLNPKNFEHYIDAFRYGAPQHAGWSIGLERFTTTLLDLNNIREACLFPRDRDRLTP